MRAAWLAGLIDGEGSVGVAMRSKGARLEPAIQLSMTCERTVRRAQEVMEELGVTGALYSYREKDPTKHLDAHTLHITRIADVQRLAIHLIPFAVTKRAQWELIAEFCSSRLVHRGVDSHGKIRRGGRSIPGYSPREVDIARRLKALNARGPGQRKKAQAWLEKVNRLKQRQDRTS